MQTIIKLLDHGTAIDTAGRVETRSFTRQGVTHTKSIQHPAKHAKLWRAVARRHGAKRDYYSANKDSFASQLDRYLNVRGRHA